ncbi:MAG: MFS transporter, partial [Terrimicrobiaceae bacterium]
ARWFILGGLLIYIAAFAIGPGPCIWLVIAEIYPMEVRGPAMSLATLASWLANLLVSSTFPAFSMGVGEANAFFIFGLVTLLSWLFTFGLLPETSGRTLDDIQAIWRQRASTLFSHHTKPQTPS